MSTLNPDESQSLKIDSTRAQLANHEFLVLVSLSKNEVLTEKPAPTFCLKIKRDFYIWSFLPEINDFFQEYINVQSDEVKLGCLNIDGVLISLHLPFGVVYSLNQKSLDQNGALKIQISFMDVPKEVCFLEDISKYDQISEKTISEQLLKNKDKLIHMIERKYSSRDEVQITQSFKSPVLTANDPLFTKYFNIFLSEKVKKSVKKFRKQDFKTIITENFRGFIEEITIHRLKESFFIKTDNYDLIRKELQVEEQKDLYDFFKTQKIDELSRIFERLFLSASKKKESKFDHFRFLVHIHLLSSGIFLSRKNYRDISVSEFLVENFPHLTNLFDKLRISILGIPIDHDMSMISLSSLFSFVDHVVYLVIEMVN